MFYPQNTMESFYKAVEINRDIMLEIDVWPSRDGKIYVFHDDDISYTTNGNGPLCKMASRDIDSVEAGYNISLDNGKTYPFRGKGYRIPELETFLDEFPYQGISIDIKYKNREFADSVASMVKKKNAEERIVVGSFYSAMVECIRNNYPELITSFSVKEMIKFITMNKAGLGRYYKRKDDILMCPEYFNSPFPEYTGKEKITSLNVVSKAFIKDAKRLEIPLFVWTVNRRENMERLIRQGVNGLISDYPDLLTETVKGFF